METNQNNFQIERGIHITAFLIGLKASVVFPYTDPGFIYSQYRLPHLRFIICAKSELVILGSFWGKGPGQSERRVSGRTAARPMRAQKMDGKGIM